MDKNKTNKIDATLLFIADGKVNAYRTQDSVEVAQFVELAKRVNSKSGVICRMKIHSKQGKLRKLGFIAKMVDRLLSL